MEKLTVQKIEINNLLFEYYLKSVMFWDEEKTFAPNGLTKNDFDDQTEAYALFGNDRYIGFSLVKKNPQNNTVLFKNIVNEAKNKDRRIEYLDNYIEKIIKLEYHK